MFIFFQCCRYYSNEWISEDPSRVPPHQYVELIDEMKKCFRRYFDDVDVRRQVNLEFAIFSGERKDFHDVDSLRDIGELDAKS